VLARLYRALAERELNTSQQELLLLLAQSSEDAAKSYAKRLQGLGPPPDHDLWSDRLIRGNAWYAIHLSEKLGRFRESSGNI
jgi:hypothetical protein